MTRTRLLIVGSLVAACTTIGSGRLAAAQTGAAHHPEPDHRVHQTPAQPASTPAQPAPQIAPQDKAGASSHGGEHDGGMCPMMSGGVPADGLQALVARMNAATGAAKVDAMAELLTALVEQQHGDHAQSDHHDHVD